MPLLEIEQKFPFILAYLPLFRANLGRPPFQSLLLLPPLSFHDTYYDRAHILSSSGLWVRKRDSVWEAKQRLSTTPTTIAFDNNNNNNNNNEDENEEKGDIYARTALQEETCPRAIHAMVRARIPDAPGAEQAFGLEVLCAFRTERERALVDGRFRVVLDRTCFGHVVGEVEIEGEDAVRGHEEIGEFRRRYGWFFGGDADGKGKLTAYFERFGIGDGGRGGR